MSWKKRIVYGVLFLLPLVLSYGLAARCLAMYPLQQPTGLSRFVALDYLAYMLVYYHLAWLRIPFAFPVVLCGVIITGMCIRKRWAATISAVAVGLQWVFVGPTILVLLGCLIKDAPIAPAVVQASVFEDQSERSDENEYESQERLIRRSLAKAGIPDEALDPFSGDKTFHLDLSDTDIEDLSFLEGLPIHALDISRTPVSDLSPIRGLPLYWLAAEKSSIKDLSPLKGMNLTNLDVGYTAVSDLAPLEGMPLKELNLCRCHDVSDISPLKGMALTQLTLVETKVSDLSPLVGMPLTHLYVQDTLVTNIAPVAGMPLKFLHLSGTPVSDLSPLCGMAFEELGLADTMVSDLSPLLDVQLPSGYFNLEGSPVADLSPLAGKPLGCLYVGRTKVTDLTPLANMPLEYLTFPASGVTKGIDTVRNKSSIKEIGPDLDHRIPASAFWRNYDAGKYKGDSE